MSDTSNLGGPVAASADGEALAERVGARRYTFQVLQTIPVTPSMRRVVMTAPGLDEFSYRRGQDIMLTFRTSDDRIVRRRFTIRSHDAAAGTLAVHIVTHGNGLGSSWALSAQPGSTIEGIGPRGKIFLAEDAAWHLFVGDETFLPGSVSMMESLPAGATAIPVLLVGSADDERPIKTEATIDGPHWVHRSASADPLQVLAGLTLPPGRGHAYLGGEFHLVHAAKEQLLQRGLDADAIDAKAYWRQGTSNAQHGEPDRD